MKKRSITNLSDLDETKVIHNQHAGIRRWQTQTLSNKIIGIQPVSTPLGINFALRYLYDNNSIKNPFKNIRSETLQLKYKRKIRLHAITPKDFLRPICWSANPGKNEKWKYK
jgi:hypothetical protein